MSLHTATMLERSKISKKIGVAADRQESWELAEEGDWRRNFATKSSDILRNLLTEDSGYIGLDSSFSSSTSSTPSPKEPREKQGWWEKLQKSTGEKSTFLQEEPRGRWRSAEPHQLLGLLASCILLACIGFSLLTVHRHSHTNNSFTAFSNGKYRSIQHGSSAFTATTNDRAEESVTKVSREDQQLTTTIDSQLLQEFFENIDDTAGKGDNFVEDDLKGAEQNELIEDKAMDNYVGIPNSAINFSINENDPDASEKDANDRMLRTIQAGLKKKLEVLRRVQLEAELKIKKEKLLAKLKSNIILSAPMGKQVKTVTKVEVGSKPSTTAEVSQTAREIKDQSEELRIVRIALEGNELVVKTNIAPEGNEVNKVKPKQRSKHTNPLLKKATNTSKVRAVKKEL